MDMDLKALDLAAESIRQRGPGNPSLDSLSSSSIQPKPQSHSQPVSPAKVSGEPNKILPLPEPQNDCNIEKVRNYLFLW